MNVTVEFVQWADYCQLSIGPILQCPDISKVPVIRYTYNQNTDSVSPTNVSALSVLARTVLESSSQNNGSEYPLNDNESSSSEQSCSLLSKLRSDLPKILKHFPITAELNTPDSRRCHSPVGDQSLDTEGRVVPSFETDSLERNSTVYALSPEDIFDRHVESLSDDVFETESDTRRRLGIQPIAVDIDCETKPNGHSNESTQPLTSVSHTDITTPESTEYSFSSGSFVTDLDSCFVCEGESEVDRREEFIINDACEQIDYKIVQVERRDDDESCHDKPISQAHKDMSETEIIDKVGTIVTVDKRSEDISNQTKAERESLKECDSNLFKDDSNEIQRPSVKETDNDYDKVRDIRIINQSATPGTYDRRENLNESNSGKDDCFADNNDSIETSQLLHRNHNTIEHAGFCEYSKCTPKRENVDGNSSNPVPEMIEIHMEKHTLNERPEGQNSMDESKDTNEEKCDTLNIAEIDLYIQNIIDIAVKYLLNEYGDVSYGLPSTPTDLSSENDTAIPFDGSEKRVIDYQFSRPLDQDIYSNALAPIPEVDPILENYSFDSVFNYPTQIGLHDQDCLQPMQSIPEIENNEDDSNFDVFAVGSEERNNSSDETDIESKDKQTENSRLLDKQPDKAEITDMSCSFESFSSERMSTLEELTVEKDAAGDETEGDHTILQTTGDQIVEKAEHAGFSEDVDTNNTPTLYDNQYLSETSGHIDNGLSTKDSAHTDTKETRFEKEEIGVLILESKNKAEDGFDYQTNIGHEHLMESVPMTGKHEHIQLKTNETYSENIIEYHEEHKCIESDINTLQSNNENEEALGNLAMKNSKIRSNALADKNKPYLLETNEEHLGKGETVYAKPEENYPDKPDELDASLNTEAEIEETTNIPIEKDNVDLKGSFAKSEVNESDKNSSENTIQPPFGTFEINDQIDCSNVNVTRPSFEQPVEESAEVTNGHGRVSVIDDLPKFQNTDDLADFQKQVDRQLSKVVPDDSQTGPSDKGSDRSNICKTPITEIQNKISENTERHGKNFEQSHNVVNISAPKPETSTKAKMLSKILKSNLSNELARRPEYRRHSRYQSSSLNLEDQDNQKSDKSKYYKQDLRKAKSFDLEYTPLYGYESPAFKRDNFPKNTGYRQSNMETKHQLANQRPRYQTRRQYTLPEDEVYNDHGRYYKSKTLDIKQRPKTFGVVFNDSKPKDNISTSHLVDPYLQDSLHPIDSGIDKLHTSNVYHLSDAKSEEKRHNTKQNNREIPNEEKDQFNHEEINDHRRADDNMVKSVDKPKPCLPVEKGNNEPTVQSDQLAKRRNAFKEGTFKVKRVTSDDMSTYDILTSIDQPSIEIKEYIDAIDVENKFYGDTFSLNYTDNQQSLEHSAEQIYADINNSHNKKDYITRDINEFGQETKINKSIQGSRNTEIVTKGSDGNHSKNIKDATSKRPSSSLHQHEKSEIYDNIGVDSYRKQTDGQSSTSKISQKQHTSVKYDGYNKSDKTSNQVIPDEKLKSKRSKTRQHHQSFEKSNAYENIGRTSNRVLIDENSKSKSSKTSQHHQSFEKSDVYENIGRTSNRVTADQSSRARTANKADTRDRSLINSPRAWSFNQNNGRAGYNVTHNVSNVSKPKVTGIGVKKSSECPKHKSRDYVEAPFRGNKSRVNEMRIQEHFEKKQKDGPLSLTDAYGSMEHNDTHSGHALTNSANHLSESMTSLSNRHAPIASPSRQGTLNKQQSLQSSHSELNGDHRHEEGIKFERLKNLPEEELMVKIKEIIGHMERLEDYHRGDGMRIQKMLGDMYWDYTHMREMIGDSMADSGYAVTSMTMLKTLNSIGIFKNDDVWFPTYYTYNTMWNFTDASSKLAKALSENDAVRLLTLNCGHKPYINAIHSKNVYYVIKASLSILHNIARNSGMKHLFDDNKTSETIMPFLESEDEMLKILATLTIANIVDEEENKTIIAESGTIHDIVNWIEKALSLPRRRYKGFTPQELTEGLNKLAVNDANKMRIVDEGALQLFLQMLQHDDIREQSSAARIVWTLSFDKDVRQKINENTELVSVMEKLTDSTNKSLQTNCSGALWVIRGDNEVNNEKRPKTNKNKSHVFLSYAWSDKDIVLNIRDRLRAEGYAIWIDIEKMGKATLETMTEAIENSAVVLVCMSEKYKQSPNCRTEAEYTFQLKKDYIPLMMQKKYRPDGWIGTILGAKLYFDFSGKYPFDKSFQGLLKELRGRGKVTPNTTPGDSNGTPVHHMPLNSAILNMGQEELIKWLRNIKLTECIPAFMEFDGRLLMQLKIMRTEAPEFFYQCLEKRLNMSLIEILKFTRALEELQ